MMHVPTVSGYPGHTGGMTGRRVVRAPATQVISGNSASTYAGATVIRQAPTIQAATSMYTTATQVPATRRVVAGQPRIVQAARPATVISSGAVAAGTIGTPVKKESTVVTQDSTVDAAKDTSTHVKVTVTSLSDDEYYISMPSGSTVLDLRREIHSLLSHSLPYLSLPYQLISGTEELTDKTQKLTEIGDLSNISLCSGMSRGVCEISVWEDMHVFRRVPQGQIVRIELVRRDGTTSECGVDNEEWVCGQPPGGSFKLEPNEYVTEVGWTRSDGLDCVAGIRVTTNTGRVWNYHPHDPHGRYGRAEDQWQTRRADVGEQLSGLEMRENEHSHFVGDIAKAIFE